MKTRLEIQSDHKHLTYEKVKFKSLAEGRNKLLKTEIYTSSKAESLIYPDKHYIGNGSKKHFISDDGLYNQFITGETAFMNGMFIESPNGNLSSEETENWICEKKKLKKIRFFAKDSKTGHYVGQGIFHQVGSNKTSILWKKI